MIRTPEAVALDASQQATRAAASAQRAALSAQSAEVSAARAVESVDTLRGETLAAISRLADEHQSNRARLERIEGDLGAVAKWLRRLGKAAVAGVSIGVPSVGIGAYQATVTIKTEAVAQSKSQALAVAQEDTDARLRRLFDEARREGRAERDRELEVARVEELRRQVAAERAASMRQAD
jgi:hypothetical protein